MFTQQNSLDNLILPYFVVAGKKKRVPVISMPGVFRFSVDLLLKDVAEARECGLRKVLLFGVSADRNKDGAASSALKENGIVPGAVRAIKMKFPDVVVMTDVCLCAYMDHGHCGVLKSSGRKRTVRIDPEKTIEVLSRMAVVHARAGADWVAPSAMADGQVKAVRRALDRASYRRVKILGYSIKFASAFYGPFRDAADSAPMFGDRRGYQVDPSDSERALREIKDDIQEGADMVMVKPALAYLDIIRQARDTSRKPLAAYNVSGEYAMVKRVARDVEEERKMVGEIMTAIRRAGADTIITYHAKDIARWFKRK